MDLMSLVAKLTLNKDQYDKGLEEAVSDAKNLNLPQPSLPKVDNTQFDAGLQEAEATGNAFKEVMSGVWEGIKSAIIATGITSIIAGIIGFMRQGVSLAIQNGKEISDSSKNLQISTKAYQEYEYALGQSNLKAKDLSNAMKRMDEIMGKKKFTEEQTAWLEELGIAADETTTKEQLLQQTMTALADYKGADKGRIIDWLFGSNANWTSFFDQTSTEIEGLKQQAEDMGLIMSDESVQNAVDFSKASEELADRLEAIKRSFGEGILPVITDAVNKLIMIVDFFRGQDTRSSVDKFADVDAKYENTINELNASQRTAEFLTKELLDMGDTSVMDANQLAVWKGTAKSLIEMVPALTEVIDVENGTINANAEAIDELTQKYYEMEKQTAYQTTKAEKQSIIEQKRNKMTEEAVKANEKLAEAEGKRNQAIDEFNKVLEKYGLHGVGYDATLEDIQKARETAMGLFYGDEYMQAQANKELQDAALPLTKAIGEANAASAEVEKLTADIEEGEAALAEWTETAENGAKAAEGAVKDLKEEIESVPTEKTITFHVEYDDQGYDHSYAIGSSYIPYDQVALLHRGEQVVTATDVRRGVGDVDYTALEDRIVEAIRVGMADATVNAYMDGEKVTRDVSERIARGNNARRFG